MHNNTNDICSQIREELGMGPFTGCPVLHPNAIAIFDSICEEIGYVPKSRKRKRSFRESWEADYKKFLAEHPSFAETPQELTIQTSRYTS